MTIKQYCGEVTPHKKILDSLSSNAEEALSIFQDYWKLGYDREVGRDTYLSRPTAAKDAAIGRIHLRPISFTGREKEEFGYSATEECWDKWETDAEVPSVDSKSMHIPTSNEWIVYCVDSNRNACMLAYLPEALDPHKFCEDSDNMKTFIDMADEWYSDNNSFPMDNADFPLIFSDNWLQADGT
ncbi:type II toxin-antitoxin system YafO family toxin [Vibrio fluvialis]|nr:type II toxin-antitoxin system YafO family toxin [Vibrio fluvialis]